MDQLTSAETNYSAGRRCRRADPARPQKLPASRGSKFPPGQAQGRKLAATTSYAQQDFKFPPGSNHQLPPNNILYFHLAKRGHIPGHALVPDERGNETERAPPTVLYISTGPN